MKIKLFSKESNETKARTVIKVVFFTFIATISTSIAVWYFTGKVWEAILSGFLVEVSDCITLFLWERLWSHIKWGYRVK